MHTYVLDTNVLLYDAASPQAFASGSVVLPSVVLEELDSMKKQMDELGRNARTVLRYVDEVILGESQQEGALPLRVVLDLPQGSTEKFPLRLDRTAHRLLATAWALRDQGEEVVLVSKDTLTRVKARSLGLATRDYESSKVAFDKMFRGIRHLSISDAEMESWIKEGTLAFPEEHGELELFPNEYFSLISASGEGKALARYEPKQHRLVSLHKLPRDVWGLQPRNDEQRCALDMLLRDDVSLIALVGQAGTGKTLLALAAAMRKVFDEQHYAKILVSRPIMPLGKDIGYLPGSKEEKLSHWMQPIYDNLEFLCRGSGAETTGHETMRWLIDSNKIEMEAVTYIRGRSLPKMLIIIDEAQNLTPHEIKTIISRAGEGTKVILTGDPTQIDNPYLDRDTNGLTLAVSRFRSYPLFGHMFLEKTERSPLAAMAAEVL